MTDSRTPKRSIRVRRRTWFAAACLVLVVVLLIQSNSTVLVDSYPRMESYRVLNERAIVLTVGVAPRSWTRVTNVTETPTEVSVKVESLDWPIPLPGTAQLELRDLNVSLAGDLGERTLRDSAGQAIPRR